MTITLGSAEPPTSFCTRIYPYRGPFSLVGLSEPKSPVGSQSGNNSVRLKVPRQEVSP